MPPCKVTTSFEICNTELSGYLLNTYHRSITLLAMVENEFGLCEKDIYRIFEVE